MLTCTSSSSLLPPPSLYRDVLDRKLQAEFTGNVLAGATHPIVMLSYITNKPHGRDYKRIVEYGKVKVGEDTLVHAHSNVCRL